MIEVTHEQESNTIKVTNDLLYQQEYTIDEALELSKALQDAIWRKQYKKGYYKRIERKQS